MDLDYFRNNINSVGGIESFNELSNRKIGIFNNSNILNDNFPHILHNLLSLNINFKNDNNLYKLKNNKYDIVLINENSKYKKEIENICIKNNTIHYVISNKVNYQIIGKVIQSIIDNKQYDISNILDFEYKYSNKKILICGIHRITDRILDMLYLQNIRLYNIYLYGNGKIEKYDICNCNTLKENNIGDQKYDVYSNKAKIFDDIDNNDEWEKIDIVINTLENPKLRKKINQKCIDLNKVCYDVGLEYSMGHIVSIIPNQTNKINELEYYKKIEFPECKIENPENVEHCIEHVKRKNIDDIDIFLEEMEKLTNKLNIQNINKYELENYFMDRIPICSSIVYYISGKLIEKIFYDKCDISNNLFVNLKENIEINYKNDELIKVKNEEFNQLFLSKIIVKNEFTIWDYIEINENRLDNLIDKINKEYNGVVFTINMNDKLLYYINNSTNTTIKELCDKKDIKLYNKNIINIILTNQKNDTILIPKIYLYLT